MDYNKIGEFIAEERKAKKLTQAKLAEKLFVSEKTISKWEKGRGVPDTNFLPKLCEIFGVSLNELLNGERIDKSKYVDKAEEKLFEIQQAKAKSDKRLLLAEVLIGCFSTISFLALLYISLYAIYELGYLVLPIVIIVISSIMFVMSLLFCLFIEQKAGFYICAKCNHKYVPTFKQVNLSMHIGRTRYMKCPHCGKYSWSKKVIK